MIYYWEKNIKKVCTSRKLITQQLIKKHWFDFSSSKDRLFTGRVPTESYCSDDTLEFSYPDSLCLRYDTNLQIYGHCEFSNGVWVVLTLVVLQEPPEIKIWFGWMQRPLGWMQRPIGFVALADWVSVETSQVNEETYQLCGTSCSGECRDLSGECRDLLGSWHQLFNLLGNQ